MFVSLQFAPFKGRHAAEHVVRRVFWVALAGFVACISSVQAQNPAPAPLPSPPEAPFAQPRASVPVAAPTANARNSWQWSQSPLDPIKSSLAIGSDSTAFPAGLCASSARGFNPGQMGPGGVHPIGGGSSGGWQGAISMRNSNILFGPAHANPPSLNQLMRGSWNQPLDASSGNSRLSFEAPFRPGAILGGLAHPPTTGLYSTTDLGNGMFLSAGTSFGHSNADAPPAVMGGNAAGARHSGPSLGVKLSF